MDLTTFDKKPEAMINYLRYNGAHFSKKLCDFAVDKMGITPWTKAEVDALLKGREIENDVLYDTVYVANMCKSDFFKGAVPDEEHVALYVKAYLDDEDGYEGIAFNRWLADCARKGVVINWEAMV